jgi:hypothetical protein
MPFTISYEEYSINILNEKLRYLLEKPIGNNSCFIFIVKNWEKFVIDTAIKYDKKGDKNIVYQISGENGEKINIGNFHEFNERDIEIWCKALNVRKFAYVIKIE